MALPADQIPQGGSTVLKNPDIALAVCVVSILTVLVIPIPTWTLDILLSLNISISIVILLSTIYLLKPVEFAVFPSLLLMLTLFRLSLNVASTRLILSSADAGTVIDAFGGFVTAGNYIVGLIIFSILVIIQFVVITKGAGRISEVAARFTLDAMPGKQMGVDADLNAGLISEDQARERRSNIEREADFYGSMDGATKFVRGDAIAGIIITLVNIVGGFVIGIAMNGMSFTEAAQTYTRLTVGDGLVSQIPALIISTAAAMIVTRTTSDVNLGVDLVNQITRYPRAMGIGALMLGILGIVPGMPTIPFFMVAGFLGFLAYQTTQHTSQVALQAEADAVREAAEEVTEPPKTESLLTVDPLKIELGYGLISLADKNQGGDLLTRIQIIRQQAATKNGFIVPVIRVVDNMRLKPNEYRILLREAEVARYEMPSDHFLAMNPGLVEEEIEGTPTTEPAFGLQALWVTRENRDKAERMGYTMVEPSAVLATHLTEVIQAHADELVTREDAQALVENLKTTSKTVVDELIPNVLTLGEVQKVLHNLLRERISIRNLETILEVLADFGPRTKDSELLTEYVRHALARQICADYKDETGKLRVVTLSPDLEKEIMDATQNLNAGDYIPIDPEKTNAIAEATGKSIQTLVSAGYEPIVLTSAQIRRFFKRMIESYVPKAVVLSYNEIDPSVKLESQGAITVEAVPVE
ncbi:MAG: flagellar biosynthesis protein FlhA [Candidatus Hydrogenedentota bacterium]|nr:MAG: flagellar biosynthesis protein FlhA [Candidatus Hydrogenedentota bacterium]